MYSAISSAAPTFPFEASDHGLSARYEKPRVMRGSGAGQSDLSGMCERDAPYSAARLIDSVVAEAGLGRFVYLVGKSGKRYVFSSITLEQASLYDNAVFACSKAGSENVSLSPCAQDASRLGHLLYVHLLDDESGEPNAVIEDLETTLALS